MAVTAMRAPRSQLRPSPSFLLACLSLLAGCMSIPRAVEIDHEPAPWVAEMDLDELFNGLDSAFAAQQVQNPGMPLARQQLDALTTSLPFDLPEDLARMVLWHDGVGSFLPSYDWLPLAEAIESYQEIVAFEEAEGFDLWPRAFLPLFQLD